MDRWKRPSRIHISKISSYSDQNTLLTQLTIAPVRQKDMCKHLSREHHGLTDGGIPLIFEVGKRPGMERVNPDESKRSKIKRALIRRVTPTSLIPLATGTAMLVVGSHKTVGPFGDCSFILPNYLVYSGAVSTSLAIVGIVGRYILEWIIADNVVTRGEKNILLILEYVGQLLGITQIIIILVGAVIIFPNLPSWQHDYKNMPNYCDYAMVAFTTIFISCTIIILLVCLIFAFIITCCDKQRSATPTGLKIV